ncbi:MAG: right-handed parallel beta-helix repeat-containing protein [Oligoflexia bacterium]|nr:right-handed parallel beta-helix repeat-containing protein [Oligoflexia bacterium]
MAFERAMKAQRDSRLFTCGLLLALGTGGCVAFNNSSPIRGLTASGFSVQPAYTAAPAWNDYVKASDTTLPCDGTETGVYACLHGGERRQAFYPGPASCEGYSATDLLGAFDWDCQTAAGGLFFRSRGLKDSQGLGQLVTETGWKQNQLLIARDGAPVAETPLEVWWSNPVQVLPDNSTTTTASLNVAGAVYVLGSSRASAGYSVEADRIAVVILPGARLSQFSAGTNCTAEGGPSECLLSTGNLRSFLWIEGEFETSAYGVSLGTLRHGRLRRISVSGGGTALNVDGTLQSSLIDQARLQNSGKGLRIDGSSHSELSRIELTGNSGYALRLEDNNNNLLLRDSVIAGDSASAALLYGSNDVTLAGVTFANTVGAFTLISNQRLTATHLLIANTGMILQAMTGTTLAQIVSSGFSLQSNTDGKFTGNLLLTGSGSCLVTGGTNPGLNADCTLAGMSDANRVTGISLAAAFAGPADWRLAAADSVVRNRTGDGLVDNEPFVPGAPCPTEAGGDVVTVDQRARTFLRNAFELQGDGEGNDNGLCESAEACLYAPNFGAYQGEGDYRARGTCLFQNGTISDVRLFAYPTNGV